MMLQGGGAQNQRNTFNSGQPVSGFQPMMGQMAQPGFQPGGFQPMQPMMMGGMQQPMGMYTNQPALGG